MAGSTDHGQQILNIWGAAAWLELLQKHTRVTRVSAAPESVLTSMYLHMILTGVLIRLLEAPFPVRTDFIRLKFDLRSKVLRPSAPADMAFCFVL